VRLGFAESSINQIDSYTGGGVAISGLLPSAYEDSLGLAIAVARNSGDYRAVTGPETLDREINLELTWRIRVSPRLVIQPDLQFVHHPGTDSTIEDAVAIGVRFVLDLQ
jgi:porin